MMSLCTSGISEVVDNWKKRVCLYVGHNALKVFTGAIMVNPLTVTSRYHSALFVCTLLKQFKITMGHRTFEL